MTDHQQGLDAILDRWEQAEGEYQAARKELDTALAAIRADSARHLSPAQFRRVVLRDVTAKTRFDFDRPDGTYGRVVAWDHPPLLREAIALLPPAPALAAAVAAGLPAESSEREIGRRVASQRLRHMLEHGADHPLAAGAEVAVG